LMGLRLPRLTAMGCTVASLRTANGEWAFLLFLCRGFGRQHPSQAIHDDGDWRLHERSPSTYGPICRIFERRFLIVVPAKPPAHIAADTHHQIATNLANAWYAHSRGSAEIVLDEALAADESRADHCNLVVVGGQENAWVRQAGEGLDVPWPGQDLPSDHSLGSAEQEWALLVPCSSIPAWWTEV
jgi:hypothetical protein